MRVTVGTETFEGTTKELCEFFNCSKPQDLPKAIEDYKKKKGLAETLPNPKPKNFMENH